MPGFDGNGNFSFTYNWVNDAANGIPITASRMDTQFNDAALGFDDCMTRDGQSPATADIPLGGFKLTGVAPGTVGTDAATIGQLQTGSTIFAVGGGTAQAITATYVPPNTALTDGLLLGVRASAANTASAPTFSPDSLTAHPITKFGGIALIPGDIYGPLHELLLRYDLANTRWELLNPSTDIIAQSLGANGYEKRANGMIRQWGNDASTSTSSTVTFPLQFPTACFSVVATIDSTAPAYCAAHINSTANFTIYKSSTSFAQWEAVGN